MDAILVVNAGSSSVKFQIFGNKRGAPRRLIKGPFDGIGNSMPSWLADGVRIKQRHDPMMSYAFQPFFCRPLVREPENAMARPIGAALGSGAERGCETCYLKRPSH